MRYKELFGEILLLLLCYGGYAWALAAFFGIHLGSPKTEKKRSVIFATLLTVGSIAIVVVSEVGSLPFLLMAALQHGLLIILVMMFFEAEAEKKFLGAVLVIAMDVLVGNFGSSMLSCFVLLLRRLFFLGETTPISLWGGYLIGAAAKGCAILAICLLSGHLAGVFTNKIKRWYILLAVPLVFIVAVVDVINYGASIGVMVVSEANGADYWNTIENEIFSHIAICIVTALSMCAAGIYVFGMTRIYLEQQKKEQYQAQVAFYKMLEEQYGQMERIRHDMKNHLIGLTSLWRNKEWEKMGIYLSQMMEAGDLGQSDEVTGSKVVDALLYEKRRQAEKENIRWECDVQIPEDCVPDEFDLCVVIGNLADNALEGVGRIKEEKKENRYVRIRAGVVKKCFLLEVENGTTLKKIDEIGNSSKDNPKGHGIGLLNVREVVEKYDGVLDMEVKEGIFRASLLVPLQ